MALPPNQQRFVDEYLKDLNATQAAIRAGYSEHGASVQGSRLLANAKVAAAVKVALAERAKRTQLSAAQVLEDIVRLAQKAEDAGELGVAMKGRELLGKHFALFTEKVEHSGGLTLEQLILGAKRVKK